MDIATNGLISKAREFVLEKPQLVLALVTSLIVLFVLLVAQLFFGTTKQMFLLLAGSFMLWTAIYWFFSLRSDKKPHIHLIRWLLPWIVGVLVLLGAIYFIDRAGWLWFRVTGYDLTWAEDLKEEVAIPPAEFVVTYPQFELDDSGIHLPQGEYTFDETVIIPQDTMLTIEPGTVLRFGAGRSLISYSPIIARGVEGQPILFSARNPWLKWGVIGVVEAAPSLFEYVRFEHSRQAKVNDIDFFAGLSLIESDSEIRDSSFENAFGKDAVNVRYSDVQIQNNVFRNAHKDCLDLDGGSGEISGNLFVDCDDEGIDLSENESIEVFDNTILDKKGGRLAADLNEETIIKQNILGFSAQGN